ncbi:MAG: indole-3-glycerol phosphate synthase TrpC [Candidatus Solibacter usitatus]|nr:indole-3-glycerol phosphate synthase TrpC [Candidatus Solibacter usitatus]
MVSAVPDVLARIVEHKRTELLALAPRISELETLASMTVPTRRDFKSALTARPPAIIAEAKKASPSKGLLCAEFDAARIATDYESGGAAALSVLTDRKFFQGSLADMSRARAAVRLPVLRKDFTFDESQVLEAAAHGADAVLLIAAILTAAEMRSLRECAALYKLASLVEVHDDEELTRAIDSGAEIIGVNNRNLHTFEVDLETSVRMAARIPANVVRVSESGIHSAGDVRRLRAAGYHAFLVGEHLMKSANPGEALRCLLA